MTDEELNETAKMMEWMMADWARAAPDDSDWCAKAASAIRQLMRERDETRDVMRQISMACDTYGEDLSFGDMKTVHRIQGAARAFLAKHPPGPS